MSLKLRKITKRFENKLLYDNLSFDFPDKGIVAITGESGIGKTTLLRIIAGLDKQYDGEVFGGGIGAVSFAFQEYRLFPELTALQNVFFSISDGKDKAVFEKAKQLLLKLGFSNEDLELLPQELSGGMKQRVSLARAFLKQCPILLLDEPTKELDAANIEIIRQMILQESKNRLVIIVSHNNTELEQLNAQQLIISKIQ